MRRRSLLRSVVAAGATGGLAAGGAGCLGVFETETAGEPAVLEDRPDGIYVPTHVEGMATAGMDADAGYRCALTWTYPHRFWTVTGDRTERVEIADDDTIHLMPFVFHEETGVVPPDRNPQVTIERDGETVVPSLSPWTMLSQPMGVHFGDNVGLDGDGSYDVTVEVGGPSTRRTGALADAPEELSFSFTLEYSRSALEEITYTDVPADREGTRGAVEPMGMEMLPSTAAPPVESLPGTVRGTVASGDVTYAVTTLADAFPYGGASGETYVAVSPRTRYNRYQLPHMSIGASQRRGADTRHLGSLTPAIDPGLGYHYGTAVEGVDDGDELALAVQTGPQMARHEGYETAFVGLDDATLTL